MYLLNNERSLFATFSFSIDRAIYIIDKESKLEFLPMKTIFC